MFAEENIIRCGLCHYPLGTPGNVVIATAFIFRSDGYRGVSQLKGVMR